MADLKNLSTAEKYVLLIKMGLRLQIQQSVRFLPDGYMDNVNETVKEMKKIMDGVTGAGKTEVYFEAVAEAFDPSSLLKYLAQSRLFFIGLNFLLKISAWKLPWLT